MLYYVVQFRQIFELFDRKRNGVTDIGEFVRSLSIFHPKTPEAKRSPNTIITPISRCHLLYFISVNMNFKNHVSFFVTKAS